MAPKRPATADPAPSSSSSSDVATSSDEEREPAVSPPPNKRTPRSKKPSKARREAEKPTEDESDSDFELDPEPKSQPKSKSKAKSKAISTDDEGEDHDFEEREGEGEEGSEPPAIPRRPSRKADPSIKPIKSRPMDSPKKPALSASSSKSRSKRQKNESSSPPPPSSSITGQFKRLWALEDEITILHGLKDYLLKNGSLPGSMNEMESLHRMIRGSLTVKVSTVQLSDKVRGLKRKYRRAFDHGHGQSSSDSHEKALFELSKKIWDSSQNATGGNHRDHANDKNYEEGSENNGNEETPEREKRDGKSLYPYLYEVFDQIGREDLNMSFFKRESILLDESKATAMEKKLTKFRVEEIKKQLKRTDLIRETVKFFVDSLEKS